MVDLTAFSAEQVCRLTDLTKRQLAYWDKTFFFSPSHARGQYRSPYAHIYSFKDVVHLRTIALLRKRVPLQELRIVAEMLRQRSEVPWSSTTFFVIGRRVAFDLPGTNTRVISTPPGQAILPFHMEEIARQTQLEIDRHRQRNSEMVGRVARNRYIVHNAPVLAGTRIPTSAVWNLHEAGYDIAAIIREYPRLVPADVEAALAFEKDRRQKRAS